MSQPVDEVEVLVVPDFSDFARQLKSGIDQALRGAQVAVAQAFGQIEDAAARAGREMGLEFQQGGERAESAFRETSRVAKTEFAEIDVAAGTAAAGVSSKLGGALAIVKVGLLGVAAAAAAGLAAMTGFGLKSAASLEQSQVAFTSLLGSADQAKTFLTELQSFAAETPFEFADVVGASQRLLVLTKALGETKDAVVPLLTTIGDLVSVTGGSTENIDSVVRALSQMASKGKISQEEIMQLAEALPGFNANAAIASQLGLSTADTLAKISAGGVDATTGINALIKGMQQFPGAAGAMAAQAQTLTGVFSTFKDTIGIALTNAFQPVIPQIKSALSELTPVLGDAIGKLAPALGNALTKILPFLGKLVEAIVPILTPILDALGPMLDALGPALLPLGEAIGQMLVALAPIIPVLAEFITSLAILAVPILKVLAATLGALAPVFEFMAKSIHEFNRALLMIDWTAISDSIGGAFAKAWEAVKEFFVNALGSLLDFKHGFDDTLRELKDGVDKKLQEILEFFRSLPGRVLDALANLGATLVQSGKDLVAGLWEGISSMGGWLWSQVTGFVNKFITQPVKDALHISSPSQVMADEVGRQIPAGIAQGVQAGAPDLASMLGGLVPTAQMAGGVAGAGAGAASFGAITINLVFNGGAPSEGEARRAGSAAADALMARIVQQRTIALAGRSA